MSAGESILVVEDSIEIQEILKMLLEQEGYSVVLASAGQEALKALSDDPSFSLVLLDISLPDMFAFEFLEKLGEAGFAQEVPIVLCSAASDLKEMKLPTRVVGILPKPFKIEELFSTIKKFSRSRVSSGLRINIENQDAEIRQAR